MRRVIVVPRTVWAQHSAGAAKVQITAALAVAAAAAILGAAVGGTATHFSNDAIQSRQLGHEEALQRKEAQGEAGVFLEQTLHAQETILVSLESGTMPTSASLQYFALPSAGERQGIFAQLDRHQTRELVFADQSLQLLKQVTREEPGKLLIPVKRRYFESWFVSFQDAETAMEPFTGIPAPTVPPQVRALLGQG